MNRRTFIASTALAGGGLLISSPGKVLAKWLAAGPFTLPPLPYANTALEPHLDAQTMELHHDKHHAAYVAKLNEAVSKYSSLRGMSLEDLIRHVHALPEEVRIPIRNNGGGHWNHSFFWPQLSPTPQQVPATVLSLLTHDFGSWDQFKMAFNEKAKAVFGSGWAWLIRTEDKKLVVTSTPNQDNPLMEEADVKGTPMLGIDVWEHAYYLKYQNRRAEYLDAFWNVVNWAEVERRLS